MEQIMKNLRLTLKKVREELLNNRTQEAKTLMNTYQNLLQMVNVDQNTHMCDLADLETYMTILETVLLDRAYEKTTYFLNCGEYKDADNMVLISNRIKASIYTIKNKLNGLKRDRHLPQHWSKNN